MSINCKYKNIIIVDSLTVLFVRVDAKKNVWPKYPKLGLREWESARWISQGTMAFLYNCNMYIQLVHRGKDRNETSPPRSVVTFARDYISCNSILLRIIRLVAWIILARRKILREKCGKFYVDRDQLLCSLYLFILIIFLFIHKQKIYRVVIN